MAEREAVQDRVERLREHATDLLNFAQWLNDNGEKLEELPHLWVNREFNMYVNRYNDDDGELDIVASQRAIAECARIFGNAKKQFMYDNLEVQKKFGSTVTLTANVARETVCTKKVVKREYIKHKEDGYWNEEVEWDCHTPSILALADQD